MSFGRGDRGIRWMGGRIPRGSRAAILTGASAAGPGAEVATPVVTSHKARAKGSRTPANLEIPYTLISMFPPESRSLGPRAAVHRDLVLPTVDTTSNKIPMSILPQTNESLCSYLRSMRQYQRR